MDIADSISWLLLGARMNKEGCVSPVRVHWVYSSRMRDMHLSILVITLQNLLICSSGHGGIKLVMTWKLHPSWPSFIRLKGAPHSTRGEKWSPNLPSSVPCEMTKVCPLIQWWHEHDGSSQSLWLGLSLTPQDESPTWDHYHTKNLWVNRS